MMMPTLATAEPGALEKMIFGPKLPASESAAWSDGLFMMITWFSVLFFVLLMGLMFYFMVKYRRREGVPTEPSPHHNTLLEVFWTVVPSSSLLVMFVLGFQGYTMAFVSPDDAMELRIEGNMWNWIATYPNGATSPEFQPLSDTGEVQVNDTTLVRSRGREYPIFYLPENTAVKFRMYSADVIHSFWIPEFRVKRDVMPNRYTTYGIQTPKLTAADTYTHQDTGEEMLGRDMWVFCAEYCGDEHSRMAATIRIVPQDFFDQKMEEWGIVGLPWEEGEKIFKQKCASCHKVDGTRSVGPPWNQSSDEFGAYGWGFPATLVDGTTVDRDENYYRESILDPDAKHVNGNPGGGMNYIPLSETEINNVISYIQTLSELPPNPQLGNEGEGAETETGSQAEEAAGSES